MDGNIRKSIAKAAYSLDYWALKEQYIAIVFKAFRLSLVCFYFAKMS